MSRRQSALLDTRIIYCGDCLEQLAKLPAGCVDRKKRFFVAFDFAENALREIDGFFRKSGRVIIPLTVQEILEEQIARKLA